jgi:Tfp pilus assembly major pilin PilA
MRTRRFTLIELMVVIGIALLLVGLAATAYTRIAASQQVDASTATLSGALMEARQLAVSRRKYVAVLMPGTEGSTPAPKAYACYRPAFVLRIDGTPVTYTFDAWPEGSKWEFTGNACSIMEADDVVGIEDNGTYQSTPKDNTYTTVGSVDLRGVGGTNPASGVRAVIFAPSGRAAQEYYVTVGQANYLGGRWLVQKVADPLLTKNHSCANQLTLKINRFSGAVSCIRPENY